MAHDTEESRDPQPPKPDWRDEAARGIARIAPHYTKDQRKAVLIAMRDWARRQRARGWDDLPEEAFETAAPDLTPEQIRRALHEMADWRAARDGGQPGWAAFEQQCRDALAEKPPPEEILARLRPLPYSELVAALAMLRDLVPGLRARPLWRAAA